jgi:hypothetical protein
LKADRHHSVKRNADRHLSFKAPLIDSVATRSLTDVCMTPSELHLRNLLAFHCVRLF